MPATDKLKLMVLACDGVIQEHLDGGSPLERRPLPGSLEAVARLCQAGYRVLALASPAADAASREAQLAAVDRLQKKLATLGGRLEAVLFGRDQSSADLVRDAARRLQTGLDECWWISDRGSELDQARQAGARPVLVKTGLGAATAAEADLQGVKVYDDLAAASHALLGS